MCSIGNTRSESLETITATSQSLQVGTKYQLRRPNPRFRRQAIRFASCRAPDARVALRQPAGDARGDRGRSLDVQEVTEVRHDLEDTRVEQPTVLVGRRHDAAVVAAMELQQGCCNVRLGLTHAIDERRERAHDRAVVPRAVRGGCARDRRAARHGARSRA